MTHPAIEVFDLRKKFRKRKGLLKSKVSEEWALDGVYYPVSVLPKWIQPLSALSPATYTLSACRKLVGIGNPASTLEHLAGAPLSLVTSELVVLALMGVVLIPSGLWVFGRVERWAKHTGKLKRTG